MNKKKEKPKKQKRTKKITNSGKIKSLNQKIDLMNKELESLKDKNLRIL